MRRGGGEGGGKEKAGEANGPVAEGESGFLLCFFLWPVCWVRLCRRNLYGRSIFVTCLILRGRKMWKETIFFFLLPATSWLSVCLCTTTLHSKRVLGPCIARVGAGADREVPTGKATASVSLLVS